jgi:RNA recognition motif-containing protein
MTRLYVGNLPYSCSEEELRKIFEEFNPIRVNLIINRETNQSKGFGFVEFASQADAQRAMEALDKKTIGGKTIVVNEARPPQRREGGDNRNRDDNRDNRDRFFRGKAPQRFGRQ